MRIVIHARAPSTHACESAYGSVVPFKKLLASATIRGVKEKLPIGLRISLDCYSAQLDLGEATLAAENFDKKPLAS